jgi:PDZ domain-containing protein
MKLVVLFVLLTSFASAQTRVFLEAGAGYKTVPGVDHPVPRSDSAGHNQFMELAKTFLQRCPELTPTVNKDKADFVVTMNWAPTTRYFIGGKLIHKPDQILVVNKEGDIIFSGVARTVGGNTEDACKAIMHSQSQQGLMKRAEPAKEAVLEPKPVDPAVTAHTSVEVDATAIVRNPAPPTNSLGGMAQEARIGVWFTGNPTAQHNGLEIAGVQANGPADSIDIKPGDIIISIDGHYIYSVDDLRAELLRHEDGERLAIHYRHDRLTYDSYLSLNAKVSAPLR